MESEQYDLPFYCEGKLKRSTHVLYGTSIALFLAFVAVPGHDHEKKMLNVFFLLIVLLFGSMWYVMAFAKKPYIKITEGSIAFKKCFGKERAIRINRIIEAKIIWIHRQDHMCFWVDKEEGKQSLSKSIDRFIGMDFALAIPLFMFSNVDFAKLMATVARASEQEARGL